MKKNYINDYAYTIDKQIWERLSNYASDTSHSGYENDYHSQQLVNKVKKEIGLDYTTFVPLGTAANVLCLNSLTSKIGAVASSDCAHIVTTENNAPFSLGIQSVTLTTKEGKIDTNLLELEINSWNNQAFRSKIEVISITQPTEMGTYYTIDELQVIRNVANKNNLLIHVDGARIFNYLVKQGTNLSEFNELLRPDALFIGGTKSGILGGELVSFSNKINKNYIKAMQKKLGYQNAKGWIGAIQFDELLFSQNELWKVIASQTLKNFDYIYSFLQEQDDIEIIEYSNYTNIIFVNISDDNLKKYQDKFDFSIILKTENNNLCRFVSNPFSIV